MKRLFYDADVLFAASCSSSGAAFALSQLGQFSLHTSERCIWESRKALEIKCPGHGLDSLLSRFSICVVTDAETSLMEKYVTDAFDAHVVAAAAKTNADFLTTYNTKHYKLDDIETDLEFRILVPKFVLFYARNVLSKATP